MHMHAHMHMHTYAHSHTHIHMHICTCAPHVHMHMPSPSLLPRAAPSYTSPSRACQNRKMGIRGTVLKFACPEHNKLRTCEFWDTILKHAKVRTYYDTVTYVLHT